MLDINTDGGYFLHLLRCAVKDEKPQEKPDGVSLDYIYRIAVAQKVSNILWYSVTRLNEMPSDELFMKWQTSYGMFVNQTARQDFELECLYCAFEKENIDVMPLKGSQIRRYYPQPDMRTMGDIDLLVKVEDTKQGREQVRKIMYSCDYEADILDDGQVDGFRKSGDIYVEIHYEFMAKNHVNYDNFKIDWNSLIPTDRANVYAMSLEDLYYYNIGHFAKNMSSKGNAVRSVLDTYVMWSKMSDREKRSVDERLERIGLKTLNDRLVRLSQIWFDGAEYDEECRLLERYLLNNSAYGSMRNCAVLNLLKTADENGEYSLFRKYMRRIFPTADELYGRFSVKHRCAVLLPFLWLLRIILLPFSSKKKLKNIKNEINDTNNISLDEIEELKSVFSVLGIDYSEY